MIAMDCPWCEAGVPLDPDLLAAAGGSFTCPHCATVVELVAEPADELRLAARAWS
jgi:hypothetical protein